MEQSLLVNSFVEYISNNIDENMASNQLFQFKLPVKTSSPDIIASVLSSLLERYVADTKYDLKLVISSECIGYWKESFPNFDDSWYRANDCYIDRRGNLTAARNEFVLGDVNKCKILILVGSDLIQDSSSLEHVLNCGLDEIWKYELNSSFSSWIYKIAEEKNILVPNDSSMTNVNNLLCVVKEHSDLAVVSSFLSDLDYSSVQDREISLFKLISSSMYKIGFASMMNVKTTKKWESRLSSSLYLADDVFSKQYLIDEKKAAKVLDNINKLREKLEKQPSEVSFLSDQRMIDRNFPVYKNGFEVLEACERLFSGLSSEAEIEKIKECDFGTIENEIIKFKVKKESTKKETTLNGSPIEIVLSALWKSLTDYKSENGDFNGITKIEILM